MSKVFVYGTLMNDIIRMFIFREKIDAKPAFLLDFDKFSGSKYFWARPCEGKVLDGQIIELTPVQMYLADRYENFPYMYGRMEVYVTLPETGKIEKAWIYV